MGNNKKKKVQSYDQQKRDEKKKKNNHGTPTYVRVGAMVLVIVLIVSMVVMYTF